MQPVPPKRASSKHAESYPEQPIVDTKIEKKDVKSRKFRREHSMADQSHSDMTSVADVPSRKGHQTKRLKKGARGLESTSKMDSSSNASGFMSRATKNKGGIRRGDGKRSAALAA